MQLGIVHQRICPASPQENGTHERMHRELERETTLAPASSLRGQQRKFDFFRQRYNQERPHEGIENDVPASRWEPSSRSYPERIAKPEYPGHMEARRVSAAGSFQLNALQPFLSPVLHDQHIGLEPIRDGLWNLRVLQDLDRKARGADRNDHRRLTTPSKGVKDLPGLL